MKHYLLLYASDEGQTEKIGSTIAGNLELFGNWVTMLRVDEWDEQNRLLDFDAVIIGASIHYGRHQKEITEWIKQHIGSLSTLPSAFFSVSLTASENNPESRMQVQRYIEDMILETAWQPDLAIALAGGLPYTRLRPLRKTVAWWKFRRKGRADLNKDYEFTNWVDVKTFAKVVHKLVNEEPARPLLDFEEEWSVERVPS